MHSFKPLLLAVLVLSGCATSQAPYTAPATSLPAQWQYGTASTAASTDAWWKGFNDPVLDQLINQALQRNNNLAAATIKVRQAQLQAGLAENRPSFSGSLSTGANRALEGSANTNRSSGASLGVGYEIDLWNKLGSQRDVALWEARATEQDRASTALALVGTALSLPIFDGGAREAGVNQARAAYVEDSARYRQTVLQAFREVEDNLAQLRILGEQHREQDSAVGAAERAARIARLQYREGAVSYLNVIDAERSVLQQQRLAVGLDGERARSTVNLIRALGGGWTAPSKAPAAG